MSFLTRAKAISENQYATLASDGIDTADVDTYVDTGCYILNGLLSGDIYGGLPSNKITAIAGKVLLVKLSLHSVYANIFFQATLIAMLYILKVNQQ